MIRINILTIPNDEQRYPTVGDWWFCFDEMPKGYIVLEIRVSDMDNPWYEFLVARHEQDEAILCFQRGITEKQVSKFDLWYENERVKNNPDCQAEPGDHKEAPYRKEHFFATTQERAMAAELGVDWSDYDKVVEEL